MTTQHDYKAAEEWIDSYFRGKTVYEGHPLLTIYHALRLAEALQKGPSEEAYREGWLAQYESTKSAPYNQFKEGVKALIKQLEKEISDDR